MSEKPSAFVVMPFDEEFDDVYAGLISAVLEEIGFNVDRADDIDSQQNILRDVVEKIAKCDLIVADLTSSNPNVFYELGLAHALKRPVILITQSIDEVPFDLRPYRLLEYSTHFVRIDKAREQLTRYAKGFLDKSIRFGSPITDFYPEGASERRSTDSTPSNSEQEDDPGFLDHVIAFKQGYERIGVIVTGVSGFLIDLTQSLESATSEFKDIQANPNASSPAAARRASRRLAEQVALFNSKMRRANQEYANIAQETENSLEVVVAFQFEQAVGSESSAEERGAMLSILRELKGATETARDSQLDFATRLDELPRLERRLNREVVRARDESLAMAANFDKTIASISRVLEKHS